MNIRFPFVTSLKGFAMGAANVVPGVSGGTIALLTGVFAPLVASLSALSSLKTWKLLLNKEFKAFWRAVDGDMLLWLGIGVVISVLSLAKLVTVALERHPVQTWAFFFGIIVVSTGYMLAQVKGWKWMDVILVVAGTAAGIGMAMMSPTRTPDSWWFITLCGVVSMCSMILPGLSGSLVLVIFGKYDLIMEAIGSLDLPVIAVFGAGAVVGLVAFSRGLHWLMERYERATLLFLIGFVIGSLLKVWPWSDMEMVEAGNIVTGTVGEMHYAAAAVWAVIGGVVVVLLESISRKK
jgi:putative membrane protein